MSPTTAMTSLAGAGTGTGPDGTAKAAQQALQSVDADASLVIAFVSDLDPGRAAKQLERASGEVTAIGMTGNGTLGASGPIERGCSAIAFSRSVSVGVGIARDASSDLHGAAGAATEEALEALDEDSGHRLLVLMLDTRSGDQAEAVAGAYRVAGACIPLVGGGAGGSNPAHLHGAEALVDSVLAVALGSRRAIGVGTAHGCRSRGAPAIATRSDGRLLLELDGRRAADVYLERLGYPDMPLTDDEFEALAVTHPLAQPELNGDSRLRHVLQRTEAGALLCATHIPVNAAIEFSHQTPDEIVAASGRAVSRALAPLGSRRPRAALVFDCAGRKRAVAGSLNHEVAGLLGSFPTGAPPLAGLFTHGEIARIRGAKGDRNHAVVATAFA